MNERIKELADKIWSLDIEPNPHFQLCLQAFAELIVNECARSLWTEECHTSDLAVNFAYNIVQAAWGSITVHGGSQKPNCWTVLLFRSL